MEWGPFVQAEGEKDWEVIRSRTVQSFGKSVLEFRSKGLRGHKFVDKSEDGTL